MARLLALTDGEGASLPPLGGVIHSAGLYWAGALTNHDWDRCEELLRPKVLGAWNLHRATLQRDLDLFVLYSTAPATVGNAGQAGYAAANAFLDQLALRRRALGLPGLSVGWGAWSGTGMGKRAGRREARYLEEVGIGWMTPYQGLAALERLLRDGAAAALAAPMDWGAFLGSGPVAQPLVEDPLGPAVFEGGTPGGGRGTGSGDRAGRPRRGAPTSARRPSGSGN